MRNLFVCHTQAHLILACGLSTGRFKNDENHLVLFRDFNLNDEMQGKLEALFDTSLFLTGIFPASNKTLKARLRWHTEDNRLIKKHINQPYDRVFAVCDWSPPVQYCMKCCKQLNKSTQFIWLEDGILPYFQNTKLHKGMDRYAWSMAIRRLWFKYLLGYGKVYDRRFPEMGGLILFSQAYVSFPEAVREPYKSGFPLVGITDEEYQMGIRLLYENKELYIPDHSILLVIDKLDTYSYPEKVQNAVSKLIERACQEGRPVYCKFHPREDLEWSVFESCTILERTIGVESLYLSLAKQNDTIQVVGIKSTGLMSARKMGFKVYSLFNECGEENENLIKFFEHIKVKLGNL